MNAPYRDGWFSHRDGVQAGENPFNESTQPWSYSQWDSGWCRRYSAVKHGLSLAFDEQFNEGDE